MADVKWIKVTTDLFNNSKVKQIRKMPDGDSIIVIWLQLLCLAGRVNGNGYIYLTEEIPYTDEMLAVEFDTPLATVRMALKLFQQFKMIDVIDSIYHVSAWDKYQNVDGLEKIREQGRIRQQRFRENKRLELSEVTLHNVTDRYEVTHGNAIEEEGEEEKEEEKEKDIEGEKKERPIGADGVVALYHTLCPSFPVVKVISEARRKAIKARLNVYGFEDFRTLFEKAEASDFLKGANDRNWTATFDWLIRDANMAKVIDGNYDNRPGKSSAKKWVEDNEDLYNKGLREWVNS